MTIKRIGSLFSLLLDLLCVITVGTGCNPYVVSPCSNGYQEFRMTRGLSRFSFEYPCTWHRGNIESRRDATSIFMYWRQGNFGLTVLPVRLEFPSAKAALEAVFEDSLSFWSKKLDFNLVEQSDVMVSGVLAKQIIFTYRSIPAPPAQGGTGGPPKPITQRNIYFSSHHGLIWTMHITSESEATEADNIHFEHLLETFKIMK